MCYSLQHGRSDINDPMCYSLQHGQSTVEHHQTDKLPRAVILAIGMILPYRGGMLVDNVPARRPRI
jgi:hypothetical protein